MSALPVIEAVRRAGGTIVLRGDRLKLSAPEPLPQNLLEEVRLRKSDLIDHLQQRARSGPRGHAAGQAGASATSPSGAIPAWAEGMARLGAMPPPRTYPQHAWLQLIVDAERFLNGWAQQAAALGWPTWEIFGCHRRAPSGRIQGMGLILLLRGDEIAALTETEAVIRTRTGAHQTYRRKPSDPLSPGERCLVWELS
jgi:hypothetical protein